MPDDAGRYYLEKSFLLVVRQILLVRNHRQDFLHAKKRNPGYD